NPRPASQQAATADRAINVAWSQVSIHGLLLSRPPHDLGGRHRRYAKFQSTACFSAGRHTGLSDTSPLAHGAFQSTACFSAGRHSPPRRRPPCPRCFNPRPASQQAATTSVALSAHVLGTFQSTACFSAGRHTLSSVSPAVGLVFQSTACFS